MLSFKMWAIPVSQTIVSKLLQLIALVLILTEICSANELLQTLEGTVGRENYTYYRLSRTGDIQIELESLEGDADLFISDETSHPTFENCKAYSDSCGLETVEVPYSFNRPVGIGVYGHSYYEISKFRIQIFAIPPHEEELTYEQLMDKYYKYEPDSIKDDSSHSASSAHTSRGSSTDYSEEEESEGSVLWQILITLLKVIFEVIL